MPAKYVEQPLTLLLTDAILLCELAESLPHTIASRHSSLARASVMSSIFSLEAAANSLMAPAVFPKRLLDIIDKSTPLDKYQFILHAIQPDKNFDRGSRPVQEVAELLEIRNQYVHPKTKTRNVSYKILSDKRFSIEKIDNRSKLLNIPASPEDWGTVEALRVLRSVSDFFDFFVLDLCELKAEESLGIVLSTVDIEGAVKPAFRAEHRETIARAKLRWGIGFRFLESIARSFEGDRPGDSQVQHIAFEYSWVRGGLQLHQQKKLIEVVAPEIDHSVVNDAMQHFLLWFREAEYEAQGRDLIRLTAKSEDSSERYAEYRVSLPNRGGKPKSEARHKPMGRFGNVALQTFANGIYGAKLRPDGTFLLSFKNEHGQVAKIMMPSKEAMALLQLIRINARSGWHYVPPIDGGEIDDEDPGKDFLVASFEVVAFDPTSETAVIVYKSLSGNLVQINMNPGHIVTISYLIAQAGEGAQPNAPADD